MEIRWLEAFVAVAEELHFGRAAARLRLAQSPLSPDDPASWNGSWASHCSTAARAASRSRPAGEALLPHAHRVFEELELGRQATRAASGVFYGTVQHRLLRRARTTSRCRR